MPPGRIFCILKRLLSAGPIPKPLRPPSRRELARSLVRLQRFDRNPPIRPAHEQKRFARLEAHMAAESHAEFTSPSSTAPRAERHRRIRPHL